MQAVPPGRSFLASAHLKPDDTASTETIQELAITPELNWPQHPKSQGHDIPAASPKTYASSIMLGVSGALIL